MISILYGTLTFRRTYAYCTYDARQTKQDPNYSHFISRKLMLCLTHSEPARPVVTATPSPVEWV